MPSTYNFTHSTETLHLAIVDPDGDVVEEKMFNLLYDFLKPNSSSDLESTADAILDLIPGYNQTSDEMITFCNICGKFMRPCEPFYAMGMEIREELNGPYPDAADQHVNLNTFMANIQERGIASPDPTQAIWAHREAHEDRIQREDIHPDIYMLAAAQWILWYGQGLLKQIIYKEDATAHDLSCWKPGKYYNGPAEFNLRRWQFWRDGYRSVASGEGEYSQKCRDVSAKAAAIMATLEEILVGAP
ncbi:MAG: hypothetical protein M1825_000856 [Sarcosagium campestre]|nr:MAG: hypothetical protein M1825_000856 [Sarcosagium campestre]